jgi:pimeloyl-ACP methyl ester carboxylesterase
VRCPVLVVQGAGDKLTPVEGARALHAQLADSHLHIVEEAGHQVSSMHVPSAFLGCRVA